MARNLTHTTSDLRGGDVGKKAAGAPAAGVSRRPAGRAGGPSCQQKDLRDKLQTTVVLVLFAVAAIAAATFAWFSISDHARAKSMIVDVSAGNSLRFDLDEHATFDEYVKTLGFDQIAARMQSESGFDMSAKLLQPVTTSDGQSFTFEDGSAAEKTSGAYLEFTLDFMSLRDCDVHLTSADGDDGSAGTKFASEIEGLPLAMRMSFTADGQTWIYDPNLGDTSTTDGTVTRLGLPSAESMAADDANRLFHLDKETNKPVVVRIWLEGTDANCTNMLKGGTYSVYMRFEGVETDGTLGR